jgi:predicted PurR-regulated permease PerM
MSVKSANRFYFLMVLFLLAVLGYLTYQIMSPFFAPLAWAAVFSIVLYPVYLFLARLIRIRSVASAATVALLLVMIIGPFTYLTSVLVGEIQVFSAKMDTGGFGSVDEALAKIKSLSVMQKIGPYVRLEDVTKETVLESVRKLGKSVLESLSLKITNLIAAGLSFVIMIFATFFLLKDGAALLERIRNYMPFSETQKDRLARQIKDMVVSTVYGGVVVAVLQGVLGGLAFYAIGLEAPVLWGVAMSIMSFVPMIGTFAIWGPAAVYLALEGDLFHGVILFAYGVFVISMVDNILKPVIIGSRTKMHTLMILFSVLGGIRFFGMIGLVMGPLITAVFMSVFEIASELDG